MGTLEQKFIGFDSQNLHDQIQPIQQFVYLKELIKSTYFMVKYILQLTMSSEALISKVELSFWVALLTLVSLETDGFKDSMSPKWTNVFTLTLCCIGT